MNKKYDETESELSALLAQLRQTPARDRSKAAQGRVNFLAQAKSMGQAVSPAPEPRHTRWIDPIQSFFSRKEHSPMFATLVTMMVSFALLFGGAGATVAVAQGSQPDSLLYPVKIYSEDARFELTSRPQAQIQLLLEFMNRRVEELDALLVSGKALPAPLLVRYQAEMENALQIAAGLQDPELIRALERIQANLQVQQQKMTQTQQRIGQPAGPAFVQLQAMLRERARLVEDGLADPQEFRLRLRQRFQVGQPTPEATPVQPGSGGGIGPGPMNPSATPLRDGTGPANPNVTPGQGGNGPGPMNPSATPLYDGTGPGPGPMNPSATPLHNGSGPGPGPMNPSATPLHDGTGPGPGPMNPSATPASSGGGGSGPGPMNPSATPVHDGTGPGPGPVNPSATPGQGGGGGSGPGPGNPDPTPMPGGGGNGGGGGHH
jgi:hypothetical protein